MEVYYYHGSRPQALIPRRTEWPTACYHCGPQVDAAVDQELLDSDQYALVLPICPRCIAAKKKVKTTVPEKSGGEKCSAPSGQKRNRDEAELLAAQRKKGKQAVPVRGAGEDVVEAVVGKMNQGGKKFIFWSKVGGGGYGKDTCTWEPIEEPLDSELLVGHRATFKMRQSEFPGVIRRHESGSTHWVEFGSRRHQDRLVDLELPKTVSAGEYSWWRLDGYETLSEEGGDGDDSSEESEGGELESDVEE